MVTAIIGRKIGMTQVFGEDGSASPATVLKAGPCVVVQRKTVDGDGYDAVQIGLVEDKPARVTKALAGHYQRASVPPTRVRREVHLDDGGETPKEGEQVLVSLFAAGDQVDVVGESRGRGFQGVVKRHGFGGGRATHGSMFHRAPGSIGQSSYPSRVLKGMRAPGRNGGGPCHGEEPAGSSGRCREPSAGCGGCRAWCAGRVRRYPPSGGAASCGRGRSVGAREEEGPLDDDPRCSQRAEREG